MDNYVAGELSFLTAKDAKKNEYEVVKCDIDDALSSCYSIELTIANTSLTPEKTLGEDLTLSWYQDIAGSPNTLLTYHGVITHIEEVVYDGENNSQYVLTLNPWLWLLKFNKTNRIFADQTAKVILTTLFDDAGFKGKYKFGAMPTTQKEYRCQYDETDLAFALRVMSEDGIIFYFEQTETDHILHLQNATTSLTKNSQAKFEHYQSKSGNQQLLSSWQPKHQLVSQGLDGHEYTYSTAKVATESLKKTNKAVTLYKNKHFQVAGEIDGISKAQESSSQTIVATTDANTVLIGQTMTLASHPNNNYADDYNVVSVKHRFDFNSQGSANVYQCQFECKLLAIPLHMNLLPKPLPKGPANAVVVTDAGEATDAGSISQDKLGRVQVHFFWDTEEEKSVSCFLRVMQQTAGSIAQHQFIPRVNEEVIVDFINGDIDKPIIIGSVYNNKNTAVYGEKDTTKSAIKTGLTEETSHQICFDDKKDNEKLTITVGKDFDLLVANDSLTTITANDTLNITKSQTTTIEESQTVTITEDHSLKAKNITLEAETKLTLKVGSNQIVIDSSGIEIKGDEIKITSSKDTKISAMNLKTSSNAETSISATSNLALKATAQASLEGTAGVTVKSTAMAKMEGTAGAEVSSTAMTKVSGVAMTEISGALVKIN